MEKKLKKVIIILIYFIFAINILFLYKLILTDNSKEPTYTKEEGDKKIEITYKDVAEENIYKEAAHIDYELDKKYMKIENINKTIEKINKYKNYILTYSENEDEYINNLIMSGKVIMKEENHIKLGCENNDIENSVDFYIPNDATIYNFDTLNKLQINDIGQDDILVISPFNDGNSKTVIICMKNEYINELVKKNYNRSSTSSKICKYNKEENYVIAKIVAGDTKCIENIFVKPYFYLKINIDENSKIYEGTESNGSHDLEYVPLYRYCLVELNEKIEDLNKSYTLKKMEFNKTWDKMDLT